MPNTASDAAVDTRAPVSGGRSVLSADLRIVGDVSSQGSIEVLGEVEGTVSAQALIVGADGRLKGKVSAEAVDIRGTVSGKISCVTLTLRAAAVVKADANYTTLVIESGAQIDGKFIRAKG